MQRIDKLWDFGLMLTGTGFLTTQDGSGPVYFVFYADDGLPPVHGELYGRQGLLESACSARHGMLSIYDATVRIDVIGLNEVTGAAIVRIGSIFGVLDKLVMRAAKRFRRALRK